MSTRTRLGKLQLHSITVLVVTVLVAGCAVAKELNVTSMQVSTLASTSLCPFDYAEYLGGWHEVASGHAEELLSGSILDEVVAVIKTLYPESRCFPPIDCDLESCPSRCSRVKVYLLEHPDKRETIFVAYNQSSMIRPSVGNVIMLRRIGDEWTELRFTSAALAPLPPAPSFTMIDWMGFIRECNGWSLYVGAYNTDYLSPGLAPGGYAFFRSRDSGQSWSPVVNQRDGHLLPDPPISLPESTTLVTMYYHQNSYQVTRFAVGEDMTLYALTYPFSPTCSPTPDLSPAPSNVYKRQAS